jgi:hypothetical protein
MNISKIIIHGSNDFGFANIGGNLPAEIDPDSYETSKAISTGTLYVIRPSRTDPLINDVSPSSSIEGFGNHVVGIPTNPNGKLWVHMTGTGGKPYLPGPGRYLNDVWDGELMGQGYTVLDIAYDNEVSVTDSCSTTAGRAINNCAGDLRLEVLTGANVSTLRTVNVSNSVNNRVQKLIDYLISNSFPLPSGSSPFAWPNVSVSGHSQGAGHAYYISKYWGTQFGFFMGGPYDVADWVPTVPVGLNNIADWYLDAATNVTPVSKMGAFLTTADDAYGAFTGAYFLIGLTKNEEWFEANKAIYHDNLGHVVNGHAASVQDPSLASLRAQAAFRSPSLLLTTPEVLDDPNPDNPSITITLYGKRGSDPVNSTDGTQLAILSFVDEDTTGEGWELAVDDNGQYDRLWVRIKHGDPVDNSSQTISVAEFQIFEDATDVPKDYANFTLLVHIAGINSGLTAQETGKDIAAYVGIVKENASLVTEEIVTDTSHLVGTVKQNITLVATESGTDTAAASGANEVTIILDATDDEDVIQFIGTSYIIGGVVAVEPSKDTAAFTGFLPELTGLIDATEVTEDTSHIVAKATVAGNINATGSAQEVALFNANVSIIGSFADQEVGKDDAAIIVKSIDIVGALDTSEEGTDTAEFNSIAVRTASMIIQEAFKDEMEIVGEIENVGDLNAQEKVGLDTATVNMGNMVSVNLFAAQEKVGQDDADMFGYGVMTGSLATIETTDDVGTFVARIAVSVDLAAQNVGSDDAAFDGTVDVSGSGSITLQETGADTAAFAGGVTVSVTLQGTETGADSVAFGAGTVGVSGSLNATGAGLDTAAVTGGVEVSAGSFDAFEEGEDTAEFGGIDGGGTVTVTAYLTALEAGQDEMVDGRIHVFIAVRIAAQDTGVDTADATAESTVTGDLEAEDAGVDTAAIDVIQQPSIFIFGIDATEEGDDTCSMTGFLPGLNSSLDAEEAGNDNMASTAHVGVIALMSASEVGSDTSSLVLHVATAGNLAAVEAGKDKSEIGVHVRGTTANVTLEGSFVVEADLWGSRAQRLAA